jgi:hypothetical protein
MKRGTTMTNKHVGNRKAGGWVDARQARGDQPRRPYQSPALQALGDVREVTLGGSPGMGDTQQPHDRANPHPL